MNLWYRIGSDTLELQLIISVKDWLNYPTALILWKLCYMWKPMIQRAAVLFPFWLPGPTKNPRSAKRSFYAHLGWRVRQPSLDLRSKDDFAHQCYTLVSMKHYVYPVNIVQLKSKIIYNMLVFFVFRVSFFSWMWFMRKWSYNWLLNGPILNAGQLQWTTKGPYDPQEKVAYFSVLEKYSNFTKPFN